MRKLFDDKKGVVEQLQALIIPLLGIAIVLTIGFLIFAEVKANSVVTGGHSTAYLKANGTRAYNATETVTEAMADIPAWLPIIIITIIGALLIGLVALFRQQRF